MINWKYFKVLTLALTQTSSKLRKTTQNNLT